MIDVVRLGTAITEALTHYREAVLAGNSEAEVAAAGRLASIVGRELATARGSVFGTTALN
jgi:hypothetical protein